MAINVERAKKKLTQTSGGNSICDQDWIAEMIKDGSLHGIDPGSKPKDFYWDVLFQWDGEAEDINPDFFEFYRFPTKIHPPRKCNGTAYIRDQRGGYVADRDWNRLTRQCIGRPAAGMTVCHAHGAKVPLIRAAAQRRLVEASEVVAGRLIGLTDTHDEDNNPIDHKDRISASNSVLDRAGIKAGVEIEVTTPGYKKVLEAMFGEEPSDDQK
jgi:hypothetical protein